MTQTRRRAATPALLIVDAGPGAEPLERHLIPWLASVARSHGVFDVDVVRGYGAAGLDGSKPDVRPTDWEAAVAAADAVVFATSSRDPGLLRLLLDVAGRRNGAWRLKPVAIAQPTGPAGDRVADLAEAALRELHARPLDERVRWADPAEALVAGAEAAEDRASADLLRALDALYRAHQVLRAFLPVERVTAGQGG